MGDSGPLHVASLVGTPVVQLLGPTSPVENEPWAGTPWRRVCAEPAGPRDRRGRAPGARMADIPPEAVAAAVSELWAATVTPS